MARHEDTEAAPGGARARGKRERRVRLHRASDRRWIMIAKRNSKRPVAAKPKKPLTAAQIKRLGILARCMAECEGRCQRCGAPNGTRLLSMPSFFQVVCAGCLGQHAAACRAAKKTARELQLGLFAAVSP